MMLTLYLLFVAVAVLFVIVLCCAAHKPFPTYPTLPARPVGTDLPLCREAWLELADEAPYDHARFDAQITQMLRSTARWQQVQEVN